MSERDSLAPLGPQDASGSTQAGKDVAVVRGVRIYLGRPWEAWAGQKIGGKDPVLSGMTWQGVYDSQASDVLESLRRVVALGASDQADHGDTPIHEAFQKAALVLEAKEPSPPVDLGDDAPW